MAHIEWGTSEVERDVIARRIIQQIFDDLYDNGQEGLISRVEAFMSEHRATEIAQEKHHKQNTARLNLIIAILIAIAAYIAIVISVGHPFSRTYSTPDKVFHSRQIDPEVSSTQDSSLPTQYVR